MVSSLESGSLTISKVVATLLISVGVSGRTVEFDCVVPCVNNCVVPCVKNSVVPCVDIGLAVGLEPIERQHSCLLVGASLLLGRPNNNIKRHVNFDYRYK